MAYYVRREVRRTEDGFMELTGGHILCNRGPQEKKRHGVRLLIHRYIAGDVKEFFSITERVAAVVITPSKRRRLDIVQDYARTTSYDDGAVDSSCEDVESAMKKATTQLRIVKGGINAKVVKIHIGVGSVGNFCIDYRNSRRDILVGFAERNIMRSMNTFFYKLKNRK